MNGFSQVIGHKRIISHLKNAIECNKPSHAYIFHGEDGCGKRTVADIFAAGLLCESKGEKPCGICPSCLRFEGNNHPDVIRVTHEKSKISVDEIREQLVGEMQIKPYCSSYKIFIVDDAELMNEQAQNALLKTLEEPPAYGVIILLSNNINSFLDTILSRAVALPFLPCGRDEIISFIMSKKKVPDYQAGIAAACSGGNPGLALKWVDSEEFAERKEKSLELLRRLGRMEPEMVFQTSMEWGKKKDDIFFFLRIVQVWLRDVLYIKASGKTTGLMFMEEKSYLQKQAASISYERINEISLGMEQLSQRLESNVNGEISLENFLMLFNE